MSVSARSNPSSAIWFTPIIALLFIVMIYPTVALVRISLSETDFFDPVRFVGLENFKDVLTSPEFFMQARITIEFIAGALALALLFGVLSAVLIQALRPRAATLVRTILLLPWTLSMTVVGCLWLWLLNPSYGPVKYLISTLGVDAGLMLGNPDVAIWLVILAAGWWSFPYAMVLVTAALQSIPSELYEAVEIDGGTSFHKFRYVTFPFIIPTLGSTALALSIMYITLVSLLIVMTGGGPLDETTTFSLAIYKETLNSVDIAPAAVLSIVVLFTNLVLGVGYSLLLRRTKRVH